MEQLGSNWTGFHEIWYLSIFQKFKLKKLKKKAGTLHKEKQTVYRKSEHNFLSAKCACYDNVEKHSRSRQATDGNTA